MTPRAKRLLLLGGGLTGVAIALALVLSAFRSNLTFYLTPSQAATGAAPAGRAFRLGGLVAPGSVQRQGLAARFVVTDGAHSVPVVYHGLLPDLFREGKGAVVQGELAADGVLQASEVLAKHDENYMPPPAQKALDAAKALDTAKAQNTAKGAP